MKISKIDIEMYRSRCMVKISTSSTRSRAKEKNGSPAPMLKKEFQSSTFDVQRRFLIIFRQNSIQNRIFFSLDIPKISF